jgi:acetylornithine deacetylase
MTLDPIQWTRRLVDIESTTYNEGAVGAFLAEFLAGRGFAVEKMPVEQNAESRSTSERFNVYACEPGHTPDVVLSTHMDTVPPFIPSSEDEEFIYGRGSCDAKGIIAAQIAAAEKLRQQGLRVGLLFLVGEERDSAGAKTANQHPRGSRFLINGEPTDNRIALASKGALRAVIRTTGRMAHSAYPELGESATHKMVEALHRILAIPLPSLDDVGPSTLNIGTIDGGHAPNVIADRAEAQILVRLVGPSDETRLAVEEAVEGLGTVDFTLEIPFKRLRAVEGLPTMVPVLLGPGSIHVAHTPNEKLAKKELLQAVDLYVEVARQLLTSSR